MKMDELWRVRSIWYEKSGLKESDRLAYPFLKLDVPVPAEGWLRSLRNGLLISQKGASKKAGISYQAWSRLEAGEKAGTIRLGSLQKVADALDCDFIYGFRPKSRKAFSEIVWEKLFREALVHPWFLSRPEIRRGEAILAVMKWKLADASFRKQQGWRKRNLRS